MWWAQLNCRYAKLSKTSTSKRYTLLNTCARANNNALYNTTTTSFTVYAWIISRETRWLRDNTRCSVNTTCRVTCSRRQLIRVSGSHRYFAWKINFPVFLKRDTFENSPSSKQTSKPKSDWKWKQLRCCKKCYPLWFFLVIKPRADNYYKTVILLILWECLL